MTSLDPTSRCAMRPSGETRDLVRPGMSRVVGRILGVELAELFLETGLALSLSAHVLIDTASGLMGARDSHSWSGRHGRGGCVGQSSSNSILWQEGVRRESRTRLQFGLVIMLLLDGAVEIRIEKTIGKEDGRWENLARWTQLDNRIILCLKSSAHKCRLCVYRVLALFARCDVEGRKRCESSFVTPLALQYIMRHRGGRCFALLSGCKGKRGVGAPELAAELAIRFQGGPPGRLELLARIR